MLDSHGRLLRSSGPADNVLVRSLEPAPPDELGQRNAAAFAAPPERTRVDPLKTAIL